jgi:hypothetical protein
LGPPNWYYPALLLRLALEYGPGEHLEALEGKSGKRKLLARNFFTGTAEMLDDFEADDPRDARKNMDDYERELNEEYTELLAGGDTPRDNWELDMARRNLEEWENLRYGFVSRMSAQGGSRWASNLEGNIKHSGQAPDPVTLEARQPSKAVETVGTYLEENIGALVLGAMKQIVTVSVEAMDQSVQTGELPLPKKVTMTDVSLQVGLTLEQYLANAQAPAPKLEAMNYPQKTMYGDDDTFTVMWRSDALKKGDSKVIENLAARKGHDEEVIKRIPKKKSEKVQLESRIIGSVPRPVASNSGYLDFEQISGSESWAMQCMISTTGSHILLVCPRHAARDGVFVDRVAEIGQKFYLSRITRATITGRVTKRYTPKDKDEVWYFTDVTTDASIVSAKFFKGKPKVGNSVSAYYFDSEKNEWQETHGTIKGSREDQILYDMSTIEGCCRMVVYEQGGTILGGHLYGGSYLNGGAIGNACVTYSPPNFAVKDFVCPFDPVVPKISLQGRVAEQGDLPKLEFSQLRRMVEEYKIYPLRVDRDISGFTPDYYMMKPSTQMNHAEVQRFGDKLDYTTDPEVFKMALEAALLKDSDCAVPYRHPERAAVYDIVTELDKECKSSGYSGEFKTHSEYILKLGEGNKIRGKEVMVDRVMALYQYAIGEFTGQEAEDFAREHMVWSVMGKKDGYKKKKLDVGRTVQGPCLEMKVLWKVCFGASDTAWMKRHPTCYSAEQTTWVHAGHNFDMPVMGARKELIMEAVGAMALDETAFDRHMTPDYITSFFRMHMEYTNPGVPKGLLRYLEKFVLSGPLLMTDGTMYFKNRGNPSGFMNTLRLNCWANLVAWNYIIARRISDLGVDLGGESLFTWVKDHTYVEICGDDVRIWAMTAEAIEVLDLPTGDKVLEIWDKELPWATKLEGIALFDMSLSFEERILSAPGMVSRRLVVIDGILWEPLVNFSRCFRKLVHEEQRTVEEEYQLVESAYSTCCLQIYWHMVGKIYSPVLENLLREFGGVKWQCFATSLAARLYRQS